MYDGWTKLPFLSPLPGPRFLLSYDVPAICKKSIDGQADTHQQEHNDAPQCDTVASCTPCHLIEKPPCLPCKPLHLSYARRPVLQGGPLFPQVFPNARSQLIRLVRQLNGALEQCRTIML